MRAMVFERAGQPLTLREREVPAPGGVVDCAGIHMSDIPAFPYSLLWQERRLVSVANLTRRDGEAICYFRLQIHPRFPR